MKIPTTRNKQRSILGMINVHIEFVPGLSTLRYSLDLLIVTKITVESDASTIGIGGVLKREVYEYNPNKGIKENKTKIYSCFSGVLRESVFDISKKEISKTTCSRLTRWLLKICIFNFEVKHTNNVHTADCLSRLLDEYKNSLEKKKLVIGKTNEIMVTKKLDLKENCIDTN
uniref:Reverse transcriptase/retrotransposon-derived protein RNase H-like domain-containing protein n=1 Tax=Strongyloides venezuelensis TaxID=75913 RepID=A0A0K0FC98_STRVS